MPGITLCLKGAVMSNKMTVSLTVGYTLSVTSLTLDWRFHRSGQCGYGAFSHLVSFAWWGIQSKMSMLDDGGVLNVCLVSIMTHPALTGFTVCWSNSIQSYVDLHPLILTQGTGTWHKVNKPSSILYLNLQIELIAHWSQTTLSDKWVEAG